MSLRERLLALARSDELRELAIAAARMALEEAAQGCEGEEIYPEERWGGIYNVAVKSCAAAIRALRDGLD